MPSVPATATKKSPITRIRDGFVNLVNALGTSKDPRSATTYSFVQLDAVSLMNAYRGNWLARRIVDCVAEDATREWRSWQASEEQIEKLEEVEEQIKIKQRVRQAIVRARLLGGAAIIMGIDGAGDVSEPLDLERVTEGSLKFLLTLSCTEMSRGQLIVDVTSEWFGRPEYYRINTGRADLGDLRETLTNIHPSRVIEFVGSEIPSWDIVNGGSTWGDSVLQAVDDVLKDYGMSLAAVATLINDCKVDVFTIPGLTKKISNPEYEAALRTRLAASNTMKSTINAIVKDKDEEWDRTETHFAGMPPLLAELLKVVCGAAGIPMTRLVGHGSGSGSSSLGSGKSGGESDLRNYYDSVTSKQKNEFAVVLAPLDEVIERSALGTEDDSVYYEWTPLYTPDPSEEADIQVKKASVMTADVNAGLINPDVLRRARINQLVEDAFYPGIQDAVDEFGEEPEEPEVDQAAVEEHIGMLQRSSQQLQQIGRAAPPALPAPKKPAVTDGQVEWTKFSSMRMFRR